MTKRLSLGGRLRIAAACPDANAPLFAEAADAIEQHEDFKQEVSGAMTYIKALYPTLPTNYDRFIIPAPKPDPLAEMLEKDFGGFMPDADDFRAALEARGLEIRGKANDD